MPQPTPAYFDGPECQTPSDNKRLANQNERVKAAMLDGKWRTLEEIADLTMDPVSSISAQLRHLRKERFGSFTVARRARGNRERGLFEYSLQSPTTRSNEC